jgi:hypothetical protein
METEVIVKIPQKLYQRAERIAWTKHQNVTDVIAEAIQLAEAILAQENHDEILMEREEAVYRAMHVELMAKYAGQYVAIHEGKLVDYDESELALLKRLNARYPDQVVLMRQVRPLPESDLQFRSPRFVKDE